MRTLALITIIVASGVSLAAAAGSRVSTGRALALIFALPEFIKLQQDFAARPDDLAIDGPSLASTPPALSAKAGKKVWRIGVYTMVHDGPDSAHGNRWEFFAVDASSGTIFIAQPDLTTPALSWTYLSLDEWRKQKRPAHAARPEADHR